MSEDDFLYFRAFTNSSEFSLTSETVSVRHHIKPLFLTDVIRLNSVLTEKF